MNEICGCKPTNLHSSCFWAWKAKYVQLKYSGTFHKFGDSSEDPYSDYRYMKSRENSGDILTWGRYMTYKDHSWFVCIYLCKTDLMYSMHNQTTLMILHHCISSFPWSHHFYVVKNSTKMRLSKPMRLQFVMFLTNLTGKLSASNIWRMPLVLLFCHRASFHKVFRCTECSMKHDRSMFGNVRRQIPRSL